MLYYNRVTEERFTDWVIGRGCSEKWALTLLTGYLRVDGTFFSVRYLEYMYTFFQYSRIGASKLFTEGQIINSLGFVDCDISVTTTKLHHCDMQKATDHHKQAYECACVGEEKVFLDNLSCV